MSEDNTYTWAGAFSDLNSDDRLSAATLVFDGGAIIGTVEQIIERLNNARTIALLRETGTNRIVGVGSLKTPDPAYRLNKFADAGVEITDYEDAPELGYVVVSEDMRGKKLSGRLVELIAREIGEPAFATTDNETMKNNLSRSGFRRVGQEWEGQKGLLSLWTFKPN